MRLSTIISRAVGWYEAGVAVCLEGAPGLGKTSVVMDVPRMLSQRFGGRYGVSVVNGANLEVEFTMGFMVPVHKEHHSETRFSRPWFWETDEGEPLEAYDGGILFVDEADKPPVEVKKILGEACLSGKIGAHRLPGFPRPGTSSNKGWRVWFAGNRPEDRSGSTKTLDHLINRIRPIKVDPDLESWNDWADRHGVLPVFKGFANTNAEIVFSGKVPEVQGPWCTPRSLVQCNDYIKTLVGDDGDIPTDATTLEEMAAFIGANECRQLLNTIKLQQSMPRFADIVKNPMGVKAPESPDAVMLVCYDLAHRVDKDTAEPVIKYVQRFPKEYSPLFARAACKRAPALSATPPFVKWCRENSSLMATINALGK